MTPLNGLALQAETTLVQETLPPTEDPRKVPRSLPDHNLLILIGNPILDTRISVLHASSIFGNFCSVLNFFCMLFTDFFGGIFFK
jgi:hypothetical protein